MSIMHVVRDLKQKSLAYLSSRILSLQPTFLFRNTDAMRECIWWVCIWFESYVVDW